MTAPCQWHPDRASKRRICYGSGGTWKAMAIGSYATRNACQVTYAIPIYDYVTAPDISWRPSGFNVVMWRNELQLTVENAVIPSIPINLPPTLALRSPRPLRLRFFSCGILAVDAPRILRLRSRFASRCAVEFNAELTEGAGLPPTLALRSPRPQRLRFFSCGILAADALDLHCERAPR